MKKNLLIIICFMTFLSCNSPKNDGERIAEMYNKSVSDFIDEREKTFDGFISDFESYNFSSRVEARNEIESAIDKLVSEYDNDRASADYAYEKLAREYSGDFDKYNEFITEFGQNLDKENDINKILKEVYYNPDVDRLIYTIIPNRPDEEKVKKDLKGRIIEGNNYTNIKWLIAEGEIKELNILDVKKEKEDYIYDISLVVQEYGGALKGHIVVRYELGTHDDWTIHGVLSKELDYVITGKYNDYIETKVEVSGLWVKNNYDRPLAVGGMAFKSYSNSWYKFYCVIPGNDTDRVAWSMIDYKIDFVELPY